MRTVTPEWRKAIRKKAAIKGYQAKLERMTAEQAKAAFKEWGSRGGRARMERTTAAQRSAWGKLGGAPIKASKLAAKQGDQVEPPRRVSKQDPEARARRKASQKKAFQTRLARYGMEAWKASAAKGGKKWMAKLGPEGRRALQREG